MKSISAATTAIAFLLSLACDPPPPQGPQQLTYENGYAQPTYQNGYPQQGGAAPTSNPSRVTYTPTDSTQPQAVPVGTTAPAAPAATGPVQIQTTPVPLGVQVLPPPSATSTAVAPAASATSALPANKSMAVPGVGAFQCSSDAQCLLGRCNVQYGRCAYPCKSSENDCKPGNVCTAGGICMPKGAAGVKM